ncbi:hypothetical protein B1H18_29370 [Streptomyces tsukubensis]|uniref:ABC transporter permease n=2 Tax=Streptomyces tsukubensis TaxID=83656 RepID=A0A1V4A0R1_9ACTN|nr:hypothetical protein B1H18_29370 [Streptomyces tsukubensis]
MRGALAAEWTKLTTLRSTWLFLLTAVVVTGLTTSSVAVTLHDKGASAAEPVAFTAIYVLVFVTAGLAMLSVTGEYATGGIVHTFQCVPDRGRVLLAKSMVLASVAFVTGLVLGAAGTAAGALFMDVSVLDLTEVTGRILAIALYLALMSVIAVGLGAVVRHSAGTITALFLLLLVIPAVLGMVPVDSIAEIARFLPLAAGARFVADGPAPYGAGLAVALLAAWSAAALVAATRIVRRRDA